MKKYTLTHISYIFTCISYMQQKGMIIQWGFDNWVPIDLISDHSMFIHTNM